MALSKMALGKMALCKMALGKMKWGKLSSNFLAPLLFVSNVISRVFFLRLTVLMSIALIYSRWDNNGYIT